MANAPAAKPFLLAHGKTDGSGTLAAENEVVTFGFFDGTLEELERSQEQAGYRGRRASIDPLVESVVANGVYEIVESWTKAVVAG